MKNIYKIIVVVIVFAFLSVITYAQCGKERWSVKTLIDKDTSYIDFDKVTETTVSDQCDLPKPTSINNKPRLKSERTVYEIVGYVTDYIVEDDHDYHVVIEDPYTGETMVVEIVDPDCPDIINTSRYETFKEVRSWFKQHFNPTSSFKIKRAKVRITGVGFFDFIHGQRGMAPNGREIHPVLNIERVR